jgi:hypothetical protein
MLFPSFIRMGSVRPSRRARPSGRVAPWELACEVLEVVVRPLRLAQLGDDAEGERVAADTGEVLAEKVDCSFAIAGGRSAHYFAMVAFPVHLSVTWTFG